MKLLNNNIIIILIVVLAVAGLLAAMQFLRPTPTIVDIDPNIENPQYKSIRSAIDKMESWDNNTYYRIKNSIKDYHASDQIDTEMQKELDQLLDSKYLLQLAAEIRKFCAISANMDFWQELNAEAQKFAKNKDFAPSRQLLANYYNMRVMAQEAVKYGKNEQYDAQKSSKFEATLNSFTAQASIKDNPTIKQEVDLGLQALGLVRGLDRRFKETDLKTCNCEDRFGKNQYYFESCLEAQK